MRLIAIILCLAAASVWLLTWSDSGWDVGVAPTDGPASNEELVADAQSAARVALRDQPLQQDLQAGDGANREFALIAGQECPVRWNGATREVFFPTGELRIRDVWLSGKKTGEARSWHANGQLHTLSNYRDGVRHGWSTFYSDEGKTLETGQFEMGYRVGEWRAYHASGPPKSAGSYVVQIDVRDGSRMGQHRHGAWRFWDEEGNLDRETSGLYENGERVGPIPEQEW